MPKILNFISLVSALLLFLPLSSAVLRPDFDLSLPEVARFPTIDAERLIRALNLIPKDADADNGRDSAGDFGKRIVERSFAFPELSDGDSIKDLGHHAGYYKLAHSHDARMFYFFFESRQKKEDPVVIWLTGGPGCSSELALFYENGPISIANNMSLVWNNFGWDQLGFDSIHFARIDYQDREKHWANKSLEVVWRGSKIFGASSQIFASAFPVHYSPAAGLSFEIDNLNPPFQDDLLLYDYNVDQRVNDFINAAMTQATNIIYVDQPTGTGFSYSSDRRDIRHNETGVSSDLYDFLQAFFAEHPEYTKNDFYITGESFAGHYIPAFASRVHQGNKAKEGIHINLKGFAIGNGLTDPAIQYKAYTDYALENGVIKQADYERINKILPACELAIKLCGTSGTTVTCMASYMVCNSIFSSIIIVARNINYYDIRKQCEGSLCYDFSNLDKFLNQKYVRDSLGVGDIEFVTCSETVFHAMLADWMRNLEVGIPALLEDGIKLLIYAGQYDLICNWLGNSRWVHAMEWSGQHDFVSSPEVPFTVDGAEAGVLKTHGPLSFLKVHNAGHMVPMDQPKAALEMLKRWTQGKLGEPSSDLTLDASM